MSKKKNGKTDTTAGAIKKLQESYECAGRVAGKFLEILRSQLRFVTEFVYPPDTDKEIGWSLKMDEYVECVNALLSTYLKNNKDKIRQDIDGQSLQQKIMLVELTKLFIKSHPKLQTWITWTNGNKALCGVDVKGTGFRLVQVVLWTFLDVFGSTITSNMRVYRGTWT